MKRLAALALLALLGCHHPIAAPADAGHDGGSPDGGDGGTFTPPDAGPVTIKVRAIMPGHGPAAGGNNALVSGSGFVNGFASRGGAAVSAQTTVTIGSAKATAVDVIDDNRLQLVVPAGVGGPADVTVKNPNGSGTCSGCYRFQAALAVNSISPAIGTTAGGTAVTVKGLGFAPGMLLLVGGRSLLNLSIVDANTATGLTPPGAAGGADVLALTRDSSGVLRRGFVYADPLKLDSIDPAVGPTAGGTRVTLKGAGFSAQAAVAIDGAPAATEWADANTLVATTPAHAAGAADVTVTDPGSLGGGQATLPHGFLYADDATSLLVNSISPNHGPLAGGTCPETCLTLWGTGFAQAGLTVTVGGVAATVRDAQPTRLQVDLPAGAAPGTVDVAVTAGGVTGVTPFRYDTVISVMNISPASGPAGGGTAVAISGAGFDPADTVRIGALPATSVVVASDGRSISAVTPAGAPGPADVIVTAPDGTKAVLAGGFAFTAPLVLSQVSPAIGAQAGGTLVTLYGQGFADGLSVKFGTGAATAVQVLGPSTAQVKTPRGDPGAVDVSAALGAQTDSLPQGFTYFDPASAAGGLEGGGLRGSLNVTVFDASAFVSGGVKGATVAVELGGGGRLTGLTDDRGQITFADARLVLPCTVSVSKAQYDAFTAAGVASEDLSVYLSGPPGPPPPPPDPAPPPPPQPVPTTFTGHVYGFKAPPDLQLRPGQRLVARVQPASSSIYSAPPFAPAQRYYTVLQDGGTFTYQTFTLSPITFFAVFGVEDQSTTPAGFLPILLGIHRGNVSDPNQSATVADIILDTHLDQTIDATVLGVPSTPLGPVGHDAAVDLDLGQDGVIPLKRLQQSQPLDRLHFDHLPAASGQGLVFVDLCGLLVNGQVSSPYTTYLRRVFSDPGPGITLGPLLPLPVLIAPDAGGTLGPAGFSWRFDGALQPNLVQMRFDGNQLQWGMVLPSDARQFAPPPEISKLFDPGVYTWSVTASLAPGFDFAHWTYSDLFSGSWIAYSTDSRTVKVGP